MNNNPKTYLGKPCRRKHRGERYVANRACVDCEIEFREIRNLMTKRPSRRRPGRTYAPAVDARALYRVRRGLPTPTRLEGPVCECCGAPPDKHPLQLDHCHETGRFRGWLCRKCNLGLGNLGDNIAGITRALSYLTTV